MKYLFAYILISMLAIDGYIFSHRTENDGLTIGQVVTASVFAPILFPPMIWSLLQQLSDKKI